MRLTRAEDTRPHVVYRLYDSGGALLYVGMTAQADERMGQHAREKPWWPEVARTEAEDHPDRASASRAERAAILAEAPRHNVARYAEVEGKCTIRTFRVPDPEWTSAQATAAAGPDEDDRPETVSRAIRDFLRLYTDPLWREARVAAAAQGTTVTAVLREALARYVRRHEKTKGEA